MLLEITLGMLPVVALELMVGAVSGVTLAKEIFFCRGVWTGASAADEIGSDVTGVWTGASAADELGSGVTGVWMIRGVLLGGKLGEDD